jgi:plastocyanin
MQKTFTSNPTQAWLCLLALGLLVFLAACGSTTTPATTPTTAPANTPTAVPTTTPTTAPTSAPTMTPASTGNSVTIANFAFSPQTLMVKTGTKVTWTNKDSATHTVTADQGAFNSGPLAPGNSFSFTFTKAGSYAYHCMIHPSMMATIVVQ